MAESCRTEERVAPRGDPGRPSTGRAPRRRLQQRSVERALDRPTRRSSDDDLDRVWFGLEDDARDVTEVLAIHVEGQGRRAGDLTAAHVSMPNDVMVRSHPPAEYQMSDEARDHPRSELENGDELDPVVERGGGRDVERQTAQ